MTLRFPESPNATLLLMPAWVPGGHIGVKMVSVFPGNANRGLPAIFGSYLLSSGLTGELLAMFDGGELTARRTAAASALAASYLARPDADTLLVVGSGRLAGNLAQAHCAVRPIRRIIIWGRDPKKAEQTVREVRYLGLEAEVGTDLQAACAEADIISTATLSQTPLIHGAWLKPGTHLDLVGAFKPSMRESDDEAVLKAKIFVDTRHGAMHEGGDIAQPLAAGIISADQILADLSELAGGTHPGRTDRDDITLFKSVGAALEDLAAAVFALQQHDQAADKEG